MLYNFEKIIVECLAIKYGIDIDSNCDMKFNSKFRFQYRRILDKILCGVIRELIESERIYKIMLRQLTVTQRLYIVLFYFFDLSYEEIAEATFSTKISVKTQKTIGLAKIKCSLKNL